jgi:endoglucanase
MAILTGAVISPLVAQSPAAAAPSPTGKFNYAEALQESMLFYESQRSGKLPSDNRVSWRGGSDLTDGSDHGLDLTGGYHDAGDEVKFGFPGAYAMTTLAWGGITDAAGYAKSGQTQYLLRNLRWGDDYIIKAHPSAHVFYGQVGDAGSDHAFWGPPEVNPSPRPSYAVTESCPGSDLVGESAAALASSSLLFQSSDPGYAATLVSQAKSLYQFADGFRGTYDACITAAQGYYHSWSGYWDDLTWGAIWLYKATGDTTYLTKAQTYYANMNKMSQTTTPEFNWTINWDDKSFGCYLLLAELTGQQQYLADAERNLDWFTTGVNGSHVNMSGGGEAVVDVWGTARYAANAAFLALELSNWLKSSGLDPARQQTYHDFGVQQINYILGDNPKHISYEVGFTDGGQNTAWPKNPHSRGAHGSWTNNLSDPPNNRHTAIGELVGGPNSTSDAYTDDRGNYQQNEGALDYNSLFSGALAELTGEYGGTARSAFPPVETPDGAEMFMQAAPNATGTNFIEVKALVNNKSAWPARALTAGTFRYYFTLDPGETPSQISFSSPYNQCSAPQGPTQFSGSVYYATLSCAGVRIAPSGQSDFRKEIQFRIIFPAAHDYTKDYSFAGLPATPGATPVNAANITLYDGPTRIWGTEPAP